MEIPSINFAAYKSRIAVPGMVDEFEKQYSAMKIPYPADTVSTAIDEIQKEAVSCYCIFLAYLVLTWLGSLRGASTPVFCDREQQ